MSLDLRGRGLRCEGARAVFGAGTSGEKGGTSDTWESDPGCLRDDAGCFTVDCVMSSEDLVQNARQRDLLITLRTQGGRGKVRGSEDANVVPPGFVLG